MKIAELFAELGFKIEGEDKLLQFEQSLNNIATAARNAALSLKALAQSQIPKSFTVRTVTAAQSLANTTAISNPNFIGPLQPAAYQGPQPPKLGAGGSGLPVSVLQGLKSLGMLGLKVAGIGTVALALKKMVAAMIDMVRVSMQASYAVDKFTTQTGLSRRELKEWERIAALSDIKAEALQETLKGLQQRSRQIRFTGEGATPFLQLGIDAMASPTEIMRQFAERTKQMDTATAVYFGGLIGISDEMVFMLRKNADKLKTLVASSELDQTQFKNLTELSAAWQDLNFNLGALKDKIVSDFAPAIKWVAEQVNSAVRIMTISKTARDWVLSGGPITSSVIPMIRGMGQGNTTKVENNVEVNVNGSDRPKETAREAAKAVSRELSDAYYQQFPAGVGL